MSKDAGRYQLMWKIAGLPPKRVATFHTLKQVLTWLKDFHDNTTKKHPGFFTGQMKYYFVDKLTGHEVGSTLDAIDRERN